MLTLQQFLMLGGATEDGVWWELTGYGDGIKVKGYGDGIKVKGYGDRIKVKGLF